MIHPSPFLSFLFLVHTLPTGGGLGDKEEADGFAYLDRNCRSLLASPPTPRAQASARCFPDAGRSGRAAGCPHRTVRSRGTCAQLPSLSHSFSTLPPWLEYRIASLLHLFQQTALSKRGRHLALNGKLSPVQLLAVFIDLWETHLT